jgi:EAL domain-containing protein (putative c-di-GMP-specific phosphodiesterase class I)
VVEGIETEEMLEALRRLGCDYAQGYLVGRPQTLAELLAAAR